MRWQFQRGYMICNWIGVGFLLLLADALVFVEKRLPASIWRYLPPGRGTPASLGRIELIYSNNMLWTGVLVPCIPLALLTIIWFLLRAHLRAASVVSVLAGVCAMVAWIITFLVAYNEIPQLFVFPSSYSSAQSELTASMWITGVVFGALAITILVISLRLSARFEARRSESA